jgi:tetratricopeptide (TPR) repeat protein
VIEDVVVIEIEAEEPMTTEQEPLISPVYTQDYFLQQGEKVSEEIPEQLNELIEKEPDSEEDKSLMVMMSFSEWLLHFKNTAEKQNEEKKDQRALKTMWQKEKLAAAMEEENEEIPEDVFEMAVNSIAKEEDLASEPLAGIYIKQGKYEQAIEMYRKLSLRNPQKSAYFARKIEEILKERS